MTWHKGKPLHRPTQRALRQAYDAQAPLDVAPVEHTRKKRVRLTEDALPSKWDASPPEAGK